MVRQVSRGRGRSGKPTSYRPAVIHATLERREPTSLTSICLQSGYTDYDSSNADDNRNQLGRNSLSWMPKPIQQIGTALIYVAVAGAVTRTLWYQYQINELSAEMLGASELRQSNMARLDSVRKEMAGLSDQFNELKKKNSGLRKERDREKERIERAEEARDNLLDRKYAEDMLSAEEMGNI